VLEQQESLTSGKDIRAMVRTHDAEVPYLSNWDGQDLSSTKYLLDKSIINPDKYDYHVGDWQNYNHKIIYMVRNIYKMLKSQFLVVLAGEESYEYNIPKNATTWDVENLTPEIVREIMDYNKHKYLHHHNLINLPTDVFTKSENIHFCTFEGFIEDLPKQIKSLEKFLGMPICAEEYPRMNSTLFEWYAEQTDQYERNLEAFQKWESYIYNYCIDYPEWKSLSEVMGIDLIALYDIKSSY